MKVFLSVFVAAGCVLMVLAGQSSGKDGCSGPDGALACHGTRLVRTLVRRMARGTSPADESGSVRLLPGVEIVESAAEGPTVERERSLNEEEDRTVLGRIGRYLQQHELRINLGQMVQRGDIQEAIRGAFGAIDPELVADVAEARKKDKGGLGAIMMMGLMMGKLLAALGFGGVGLLALKALGVSMVALLLSAILGLKKLTEQGDHKGRYNDEHFELHSDDGQHGHDGNARRRRSAANQLAYKGWRH
ncbi:uncharacterized protein LOC128722590 [Anopheles nili]|uniref:uncharacterized protein LOC128722590 n=1 Tax=Anopheles nili TaxID=185578 RepID=UPI00237BD81F|nr:uncharacterized protein LOC128722590 [Anopheles nili]